MSEVTQQSTLEQARLIWNSKHADAAARLAAAETILAALDTNPELFGKILTQDGAGSGLDADLLDGEHASRFYSPGQLPPDYERLLEQNWNKLIKGTLLTRLGAQSQSFTHTLLGSTLSGAMDASQATGTVADLSQFDASGTVQVDSEWIDYSGRSGTTGAGTLTGAARGAHGSSAAAHASGAAVTRGTYRIARDAVNNQGWVRAAPSVQIGGTARLGAWDRGHQRYRLFWTGPAPHALGSTIDVASSDVVPYQGMATHNDTVELLYVPDWVLVTTVGTGAPSGATWTSPYFPISVKLPIGNLPDEEAMSGTSFQFIGSSSPASRAYRMNHGWTLRDDFPTQDGPLAGVSRTLVAPTHGGVDKRGARHWGDSNIRTYPGLMASTPHLTCLCALARVTSVQSGSPLAAGEVLLAVWADYMTNTEVLIHGGSSFAGLGFDLFRLDPQLVLA